MKKFLLSLFALLGVVSANAQELTIADVEVVPGQEVTFPVQFAFTDADVEYRDFELHVTFPEGINVTNAVTGDALDAGASAGFNLVDNDSRFTTVDLNGNPAKNGAVWNITIAADASMAEGTYEAKVTYAEVGLTSGKYVFPTFSFNIIVTNTLTLDENSTSPFSTGVTADVVVKRTVKANTWNTIVLPFAVKKDAFAEIFGSDAAVATFDSWNAEFVENESSDYVPTAITINFKERKNTLATVLLAGTPYLIKTSKDISEITMAQAALVDKKDVTSAFEEEEYIGETYNGAFVPTYVKTKVPNNGLFIRDSKFYYSSGETVIKGFRGYFDLGLVLDRTSQAGVKYSINVDGEETSVDGIEFVSSHGGVYTLDGKFIGRDVDLKKLQKGIYVVDGKKVAVK